MFIKSFIKMKANILSAMIVAIIMFILLIAGIVGYEYYSRINTPEPVWVFIILIASSVIFLMMLILITIFYDNPDYTPLNLE